MGRNVVTQIRVAEGRELTNKKAGAAIRPIQFSWRLFSLETLGAPPAVRLAGSLSADVFDKLPSLQTRANRHGAARPLSLASPRSAVTLISRHRGMSRGVVLAYRGAAHPFWQGHRARASGPKRARNPPAWGSLKACGRSSAVEHHRPR